MDEKTFKEREQLILLRLKKISQKKYQVIWAIFVTLFSPFIMPYVRLRRMENTFGEELGYWNTVIIFMIALVFLMSITLYQVIDKMRRDTYDAERDLKLLKKKFYQKTNYE